MLNDLTIGRSSFQLASRMAALLLIRLEMISGDRHQAWETPEQCTTANASERGSWQVSGLCRVGTVRKRPLRQVKYHVDHRA